MQTDDAVKEPKLDVVEDAAAKLSVSRNWLYRLPPDTPGVYSLGRAKRFNVKEILAWAKSRS